MAAAAAAVLPVLQRPLLAYLTAIGVSRILFGALKEPLDARAG